MRDHEQRTVAASLGITQTQREADGELPFPAQCLPLFAAFGIIGVGMLSHEILAERFCEER